MAEHQIANGNGLQNGGDYGAATEVEVVMLPLPAQGHLNQGLHLSRILTSNHIPVHFVSTPCHSRQAKTRAHGWDPLTSSHLHFHDIEIPFEVLPPEPNSPNECPSQFSSLFSSMMLLREPLYNLIKELAKTVKRVVVVVDYFIFWIVQDFSSFPKPESSDWSSLEIAESFITCNLSSIPNAETYCFHSISPFSMYYLDQTAIGKPVLANGKPVKDLPPKDSVFAPGLWVYYLMERNNTNINHGNLYNSCRAIEGQFLDLLAEEKLTNADKHWAIGPINPVSIPKRKTSNKYLEWLNTQEPKSVIFVSFGTATCLLDEQVKEIALGLERSGQNFIWVLRDADTANVFAGESKRIQLPEGFEERVEGKGIIIRDWAPQLEILAHPSTGGFLSHCGWNSCMESISMGVPIAAWPIHSEQPLNAILVTQVLKIGVMVKEWSLRHEIVKSETIETSVKKLMASAEGDEMRQRAAELSTAVKESIKEGGQSNAEIKSFIAHITR